MKLNKLFLLISICTATLATTNIYAASTAPVQQLTNQDKYNIKSMVISNLDSLFPFQTQISVQKIAQDAQGNIVASDILIMSGGTKNPNISINKLTLEGLDVNKVVNDDFKIKVEGLSVTNLASSVANSNVVSAKVNPKEIAGNQGLFAITMNTISQGIYNFEFDYDYSDSTLKFKLDSSINKKPFLKENFELTDFDISGTVVDADFLAVLKTKVMASKVKNLDFDADFSEVIKDITTQYLGKDFKQTPVLDINGSLGKTPGKLKLDIDGKLGSKSYVKYNIAVADIDLENATVKDILDGSAKMLNNAYVQENTADAKIELNFAKSSFPKGSFARQIMSTLDKDNIDLQIVSNREFDNSKYNTNMSIKADGLASFSLTDKAKVDGKLKLLPYLGVGAQSQKNLYDCKDQLCLTDIDFRFANDGLLEKVARYTNKDPNTSTQQILGGYGALLQLFAVQQHDKFLQKTLSSFAMFLQDPENINVHAKAKKPVNETALLNMFINDAKTLKRHNPMKNNGRVDLSKTPNIKLLNDIKKIFDIKFDVNS